MNRFRSFFKRNFVLLIAISATMLAIFSMAPPRPETVYAQTPTLRISGFNGERSRAPLSGTVREALFLPLLYAP